MTDTALFPPDPRAGVRASAPRVFLLTGAVVVIVAVLSRSVAPAVEFAVEALIGATVGLAAARWLVPADWYRQRLWASAVLIAVIVTIPVSAGIIGSALFVRHVEPASADYVQIPASVLAVSLVMTGLAMAVRRLPTQTHAAPKGAPPAKFLSRLPPKLAGGELFAVEAEDHYLRLHTSLGQDLILMRLGDAIAELEGLEGAQTHRSWWVAKTAVAGVTKLDGRAVLTLRDGAEVPVSRGFVKDLRAAGWL